jgi:hypothetical protein
MKRTRFLPMALIVSAALFAGCATVPANFDAQRAAFKASDPKSILIVPSVNQSLFVDAPYYFLSSLPLPIADKGYYVFPVNTVKVVLEQEGLYEPEKIRQMETSKLAEMFGADAVLYVTIVQWTALYVLVTTQVTVEADYRLVDKRNTEIWTAHKLVTYTPERVSGNSTASLFADMLIAAATRAAPNYMSLVRQANDAVFVDGYTALPPGPYLRRP